VDVLVVGEAPFAEVAAALQPAQDQLGREITPTLYSPREFEEKLASRHHFLMRLLREPKIALIGDLDAVERLGRPTS
jgi:hypothetical protein